MRSGFYNSLFIFILFSFLANSVAVFGQSYGLAFASNEAVQDERTALDLSPESTLCFNESFQLSFDIAFIPNHAQNFGYIFRLIDNKKKNIDLIYDNHSSNIKRLTFVIGDNSTNVAFDIDKEALYKKWNKINLAFNYQNQTLTYTFGSKKYSRKISIDRNSCFKMLFGANDFGEFKTTDVPPMKIRNVQIQEGGVPKYKWLLNEEEGNTAFEEISKKNAAVSHPLWIKRMHYEWKLLKKFTTEGPASVAFDAKNELVHIVGLDSLFTFSGANNQISSLKYHSGRLNLLRGNQSYFDNKQGKLYNLYLDQKKIVSFDFKTQTWD
ncbi:MAG: Kelch repeat protein, partial [Daejeonella sp.]|nr:Kelch repeat protein [Daejeonella sp.]